MDDKTEEELLVVEEEKQVFSLNGVFRKIRVGKCRGKWRKGFMFIAMAE